MKYRVVITRQEIVEVNGGSEEDAIETAKRLLLQNNPRDVFTLDVATEQNT